MKVFNTKIKDLKVIQQKTHRDKRGNLRETYIKKIIKWDELIFDYATTSKKNVLRGLHLQTKFAQEKYISVLKGEILDVAVDLRKKSKTFGKHFKTILSDKNAKSIFIPAGFAHGFLALKKENIIYYTSTNYRSVKHEVGLLWNDKDLKIKWPIKNPIISKKDKKNLRLKVFKKLYINK